MDLSFVSRAFDRDCFHGHLVRGCLRTAIDYLGGFPEQAELYQKYRSLFQEERYLTYDVDADLHEILLIYQKYYRDAFYLELPDAAGRLRDRLAAQFRADPGASLDSLEEKAAEAFRRRSFHILTGRTSGYYGPYIWRTEELARYTVELPDGAQEYTVKLLDGFLSKSWLDYISFGATGTGGWADSGGLIHCVRASYDLESENFQVSLLKHEAQHAADLARYPGMSSGDLEYRAKLVELIYSSQRHLLDRFLNQADAANAANGHGLAAARIAEGFRRHRSGDLAGLSVGEVQAIAQALFSESSETMAEKYPGHGKERNAYVIR